jgi:hypothetical protein
MKVTRRTLFRFLGLTVGTALLPAIAAPMRIQPPRYYFVDPDGDRTGLPEGSQVFSTMASAIAAMQAEHLLNQGRSVQVLIKAKEYNEELRIPALSGLVSLSVFGVNDFSARETAYVRCAGLRVEPSA